jgi:hypothetical protein
MLPVQHSYRLAVLLSNVTLIAALLLPISALAIWLFWNELAPLAAGNLQHVYDLTSLGIGARFSSFIVLLFGAAIQAYGLLGVRQTFQEAAQGRTYSMQAIGGFRRYAWVAVIMVFVGIFQQTGLIAIFSLSDPSHLGSLSFKFGSDELKSLFTGLLLVFVARVFAEGKLAKDENEAFL